MFAGDLCQLNPPSEVSAVFLNIQMLKSRVYEKNVPKVSSWLRAWDRGK